jgi:hypothetical protein
MTKDKNTFEESLFLVFLVPFTLLLINNPHPKRNDVNCHEWVLDIYTEGIRACLLLRTFAAFIFA